MASSPAIKRLQHDLKSLQESPIVGANAVPFSDSDLTKWCGLILPPSTSVFSGIPVRFTLEFPSEYPNLPPKAYFETYVAYSNGMQIQDYKDRIEVCLNIFGNFRMFFNHWGTTSDGWSPSYTVSTILVSMQALMIDGMLNEKSEFVDKMRESALKFCCPITSHDGSDPSKYFPKVITSPEEAAAITASFPRPTNQTPLDTHYICYANQEKNGRNSVLGYGVNVENSRLGTLSSPCEYLSLDSYKYAGIRRSSTNLPFAHWLPILINKNAWANGSLIKKGLLFHTRQICQDISFHGSDSEKVFKVCSSIMNSLVVEIMKNPENSAINDKFINGYFALYRLLVVFKDDSDLESIANRQIERVLLMPDALRKENVPNLGEFLIYLSLSDKYEWADLAEVFIRECDARNVFWYVKGNRNNPPQFPELSDLTGDFKTRATQVFEATSVSRKLVMLQVRLVSMSREMWSSGILEVSGGENDAEDFGRYGLIPDVMKFLLKTVYKEVVEIKGWEGFFQFLRMKTRTDEERGSELVQAVLASRQSSYI